MNKRFTAFLLFILTATLLIGCSSLGAEKDERKIALENALEAMKSGDSEKMEKYVVEEEGADSSSMEDTVTDLAEEKKAEEALAYLFKHLSYKIGDVKKEEENSATIAVEMEQADLKEATSAAMGEMFIQSMSLAFSDKTEEEIDAEMEEFLLAKFKKMVDDNKDNLITTNVDVHMKKVDGEWKVVGDEAFYDAATGGMLSAIEEFADSFNMEENTEDAAK